VKKISELISDMLWNTIKQILQKQGGTCILIEEGKPAYVVMDFDSFQESLGDEEPRISVKTAGGMSEQELLEKINQEITNWKAAQTEEQAAKEIEEEVGEEEIKVEDLPL